LYELLMQQYEAAKMEELDESKVFQVIEPPGYFGRVGPKRDQMILVLTLVTLIASLVLAFLGSYRDRIVSDPEESEKIAEIKEAFIGKRRDKKEKEDG
jgi:tyrosine-protein kinase Etk/Wzc